VLQCLSGEKLLILAHVVMHVAACVAVCYSARVAVCVAVCATVNIAVRVAVCDTVCVAACCGQ